MRKAGITTMSEEAKPEPQGPRTYTRTYTAVENHNISMRLPEVLKVKVEARAARLGMQLSPYIRHLCIKDIEKAEKKEAKQ